MSPTVKIDNGKIFLSGVPKLTKTEISVCFYPSGIVFKDGIKDSPYAFPVKFVLGVIQDTGVYDMMLKRGLLPKEEYPLLFLEDGYYELRPHAAVEIDG